MKRKCKDIKKREDDLIEDKVENVETIDSNEVIEPSNEDEVIEEVVESPIDDEGDPQGEEGTNGDEGLIGEDKEEEERAIEDEPVETPIEDEEVVEPSNEEKENIIEGVGIVFNSMSEDLGGFREVIKKEAVTEELINNSDIYYLYNHNDNMLVLARSNHGEGSLKLEIQEDGLHYSFNCLDETIYQSIKRGDLSKSSFAFELPKDGSGEEWVKDAQYNYIRYINRIERLHDISCVLNPAYQATSVYARSNDSRKEVDSKYYDEYENIIDSLLR